MIGVFGGSFDPPHLGHKALVQTALHELALDEVWIIPVGKPVHRSLTNHISAQQRLRWVEQMFAGMTGVRILDWEVQQERVVPSIEIMRHVHKQLDTVPVWLMGGDAWRGMPHWVAYPEHVQWCNVAVFPRVDEPHVMHADWQCVSVLPELQAGKVYMGKENLPDVSATQIRKDILAGKDVSTVLDADIAADIQAAYQQSSNGENHE
jgi:nicotinate-nucleotide adenylyltransferase